MFPHPKKGRDMKKLEGKGAYQNYNAHYIPVASIKPQNPQCMEYYPCYQNQIPAWDEFVVFHKSQTLPRFWVKISKDTIPNLLTDALTQEWQQNLQNAQAGDPSAQYYVGLCYSVGHHIPQSDQEAFPWFQKAADQGYSPSQYTLSFCYQHGKGVIQDSAQAIYWAEKASQKTPPTVSSFPSQIHQVQIIHQLAQEQFLHYSYLEDDLVTTRRDLIRVQEEQHQIQLERDRFRAENDQLKLELKKATIPFIPPTIPIVQPALSTIQLPSIAFGKAKWAQYFGEIGQEPPLPPDIHQILSSPCPFWSGKKVQDTHMLVLIPPTVNGQSLTMKSLGHLVESPKQGTASKYSDLYLGQYQDQAVQKSYWVLMTKDILEETRSLSYTKQTNIVAAHRQRTGLPYEVPLLLEATICLFMTHASTGTRLYADNPLTYTRCQEKYDATWQICIGGFSPSGLLVSYGSDGGVERRPCFPAGSCSSRQG